MRDDLSHSHISLSTRAFLPRRTHWGDIVTPAQFIAAHFAEIAPTSPIVATPKRLADYEAQMAYWIQRIGDLGLETAAEYMTYCPECGSTGLILIGDREDRCRECGRPEETV
ncbi:unnamed protein product [marine sediment metagenome]|uniref:Uncharacterized protein n=1 Tax=marine sediment metagenome TaxID=412755 RepID=X0TL69_9ZZZZ